MKAGELRPLLFQRTMATSETRNYQPEVHDHENYLVETRRYLHKHPELRWEEVETSKFIAEKLRSFGLEVHTGVAKTGLVAILRGKKDHPCIAFRADMDALPILEATGLEFQSTRPGVMHACGHDAHMSILLTTAKILAAKKDSLNGSIKFIFQPAEEGGAGAEVMVQEGALDEKVGGLAVDEVYGLHVWTQTKTGVVAVKKGPFMAGCRMLEINVYGKGGHAAEPQNTRDAVMISTSLVQNLYSIVGRNIDPFDSAVLTIGKLESGYAENVIADRAKISGTIRFMSKEVADKLVERIQKICRGFEISYDVEVKVEFSHYYPPVINRSARCVENVERVVQKVLGPQAVDEKTMSMASEDFAFFLEQRDGCFFFVGCAPDPFDPNNKPAPHHRPTFMVNEEALKIGSSIFLNLADDLLK